MWIIFHVNKNNFSNVNYFFVALFPQTINSINKIISLQKQFKSRLVPFVCTSFCLTILHKWLLQFPGIWFNSKRKKEKNVRQRAPAQYQPIRIEYFGGPPNFQLNCCVQSACPKTRRLRCSRFYRFQGYFSYLLRMWLESMTFNWK